MSNFNSEVRILHISDLHFGFWFDKDSWEDLSRYIVILKPHLLIITGDLVNSPSRYRLKQAKNRIEELIAKLNDPEVKVIIVPGNHDTRFWGIIPITRRWFLSFYFFFIAALSLIGYLLFNWLDNFALQILAVYLFLIAFFPLFSFAYFTNFETVFNKYIMKNRTRYPDLKIEIFPFDSATEALAGARGKIPKKQFVRVSDGSLTASPEAASFYRMAILHHHPLPIPYDDQHEPLMVVDNAGAFLNEISHNRIRLILHGHKHNKHFSRITINAEQHNEYEVAVLATGSATAGINSTHQFHLLKLDYLGNIEVIPYEAKAGGTFVSNPSFFIEKPISAAQRYYDKMVASIGHKCESAVFMSEINSDGDVYHRIEYHQLKVMRDSLKRLPRQVGIQSQHGHVEQFKAGILDNNSPERIQLNFAVQDLKKQEAIIEFGRDFEPKDEPISFFYHFHALNSCAMNTQHQYYFGDEDGTEHIGIKLGSTPPKELIIIVRFPEGFRFSGNPLLLVKDGADRRIAELERIYRNCLRYYPQINVVVTHIPYPVIDCFYYIEWHLLENPLQPAPPAIISGEIDDITTGLLAIYESRQTELKGLLDIIEKNARDSLGLEAKDEDPLDISLMVFESKERVLRIVAANFQLDDPRIKFKLNYGDGIAGRAYKMNKGRMFVKRLASQKHTPFYYYPLDGKPCLLEHIKDEVLISIPIRHPENAEAVYAILNIGSRKASTKLLNLKETKVFDETSEFFRAISITCYRSIRSIILAKR